MANKLKNILIKLVTVFYGIFCVPVSLILFFYLLMIFITNLFVQGNISVIFFFIFSTAAIASLWLFAFAKIKIWIQLIIFALVAVYFYLSLQFPVVQKGIEVNMCVDAGICTEGLRFSDGTMTKEYCLEKNYIWNDEKKYCDMRSKN